MRILAIDHGTKRMGLAISDAMQMIALPLGYLPAEPFKDFLSSLKDIIRTKEIEMILVGLPRNMDGSYGPAALKVREFVAVLGEIVAIPIRTWDERLTSVQANRFLIENRTRRRQRREKVDTTAATLLLQSYLEYLSLHSQTPPSGS
ncbi:MAG TPA: Holliday junction resolvase RuvX [Candidatus Paceibacterota bacterium]|nr:Holliday junction resolvase RuvX [Verrucomicrobiota bacterium]HRY48920.1 Holliday junction resolvase RuvX [Candidatus Paceibacterota bacterium]